MLLLLALTIALGATAAPFPAAPIKGFNYTLSPPSIQRPLVVHPQDARPLIPTASTGAHIHITGSDPDPRTTLSPIPHALAIELPPLLRGGRYKRVDLRVACTRALTVDTSRLGNFGGRCDSGRTGEDKVGCSVPLAAVANDPKAGCTPGETFTDCRRWSDLSGEEKTLKIALWATVGVEGRHVQVWGLGDRCIADGRVRPTLQRPTCPDVGGFKMSQEFEVKVVCSKA